MLLELWTKFRSRGTAVLLGGLTAIIMPIALVFSLVLFIRREDPAKVHNVVDQMFKADISILFYLPIFAAVGIFIAALFYSMISGIERDSKDYARKISPRVEAGDVASGEEISIAAPQPIDTSSPEKIFKIGRQRLLDESVRIDSISRRNLVIGIIFSVISLGVLAWPLVAAAFQSAESSQKFDVFVWAAQYYLPRFAVGLLLQFVGFFFLRLYVANELDLKHNKNEITNLELKVIAIQLAQNFGDAASKKEIMRSLAGTERNFIIRKNERTASTEALAEYNDMKGLFEKLVDKIPGRGKQ